MIVAEFDLLTCWNNLGRFSIIYTRFLFYFTYWLVGVGYVGLDSRSYVITIIKLID